MKNGFLIVLLIFFFSCDKIVKKKVTSDEILQEELQSFNWKDVDIYPSFSSCDSIETKEAKKQCFQETVSHFIFESISKEAIIVKQSIHDTIIIDFQISDKGELTILDISSNDLIKQEIPKLDNIIHQTLDSLPRIFPATKRGQQVKTQFRLPIVIQVD